MLVVYELSKAHTDRVFVETGEIAQTSKTISIDPKALTPAHRAHILRRYRRPDPPRFELMTYKLGCQTTGFQIEKDAALALDTPADETDVLGLIDADISRYEAAQALRIAAIDGEIVRQIDSLRERREALASRDPATAGRHELPNVHFSGAERREIATNAPPSWMAERPLYNALLEAREEYNVAAIAFRDVWRAAEQQREQAAAAEKAQREADKRAWIEAHGSDHLRRAYLKHSHDCQRLYVHERANAEYPGYLIDFDDTANWRDRSCPSQSALDEAERVGGQVYWMTRWPNTDSDIELHDLNQSEAEVVVVRFLKRYDLIKVIAVY